MFTASRRLRDIPAQTRGGSLGPEAFVTFFQADPPSPKAMGVVPSPSGSEMLGLASASQLLLVDVWSLR